MSTAVPTREHTELTAPHRPAELPPRSPRTPTRILLAVPTLVAMCAKLAFTRPAWIVAGVMLLVCYPETSTDVAAAVHITPIDIGTVMIVMSVLPEWIRVACGRAPAPFSRAVAGLLTIMTLVLTLSTLLSTNMTDSLSGFVRYVQLFVVVPAASATAVLRSRDRVGVKDFSGLWAGSGTAGEHGRTETWARAAGPILGSMIVIGLFEAAFGSWQALTGNGSSYAGSDVRAVGTFGSLDVMGMATVIGFGMVASLALALVTSGWRRALCWVLMGSMLPAMIFSLSRGSWIATTVACAPLAIMILGRKLIKWGVLFGCAGLVGLALTGGLAGLSASNASAQGGDSTSIVARFTSIFSSTSAPDQSVTDRYSLWSAAIGIGEEYPLSGVGLKQFQNYRDSKAPIALSGGGQTDSSTNGYQVEPLLSPHNMYLLAFSEQGVPGGAVFLFLLVGLPMLALLRLWRIRKGGPPAKLAFALAAAGWGLWGMLDFLYADIGGPTTVLYSVLLGIVLAHALPLPAPAGQLGGPPGPPARPARPEPGSDPDGTVAIVRRTGAADAAPAPAPAPASPMIDIRAYTAAGFAAGHTTAALPPPTEPRPVARPAPRMYGEPTPLDEIVPGQTMPDLLPPAEGGGSRLRSISLSRLARGSMLTTAFNLGGSVLGLVRDLLLAKFFGASGGTDAFLVAWTVPETAAPLLIEDGMSYLMVPVFSKAARTRRGTRYAVDSTWLPLTAVLSAVSVITILIAPVLVKLLAPGLQDPTLAISCTRLAGLTILFFGLTGYAAAGLRSHHVFGSPAAIYLAYNFGILLIMIDGHARFGVQAAAAGLSIGAALMVVVQAPSFIRVLGRPGRAVHGTGLLTLSAVGPIVAFALSRQSQVFIERYYGSQLDAGTISLLNYSQKVSQVPMSLAVMITAVSFPTLSRAVQSGQFALARQRIRRDLTVAVGMVAVCTLIMIVASPLIIQILFQHGEFTAKDTADTASIMRVYVLGLVGQTTVGVVGRLYFSRKPSWFPTVAMCFGAVATAVISSVFLHSLGANAIALGNAVGITLTAVIMLGGANHMLRQPKGAVAAATEDAADAEGGNLVQPPPRRYDEL
ncbi:MAG TPA: lipid II flippase MurJ [Actinocrinis sp.]|nr:lipid II flippase MurJ [Actinocrinis sp.]